MDLLECDQQHIVCTLCYAMSCCARFKPWPGECMTTSARGRHRKLRRNILHTVIATALLAGTFTAIDQSLNIIEVNTLFRNFC
jgi:hypothetical protein